MPTTKLPPPPISSPANSYAWQDWQTKLQQFVVTTVVTWSALDKTGSNLSDIVTRPHNVLQSIQGGALGEYNHLTNAQVTALNNAAPLASPTFTGTPKAPTPVASDNSTNVATTAYVKSQNYAPLVSPAFTTSVGFNGTAPAAKPTVTGSRGGNAALASLLTALANYGLITDSTTA